MSDELGTLDGAEVVATSVAVTNAGDGLSAAMEVDPELISLGDVVYLVLRCECTKVRFEPVEKGSHELRRVHVLRAGDSATVDPALVAEVVTAQRHRIEEAAGVMTLPFEGLDEDGEDATVTPIGGMP